MKAIILINRGVGRIPALWDDEGELVGVLTALVPQQTSNAAEDIESLLQVHHGTSDIKLDESINTVFSWVNDTTEYLTYWIGDEIAREVQLTWTRA